MGCQSNFCKKFHQRRGFICILKEIDIFWRWHWKKQKKALKENTYPVGAVIVDGNNNVIARGRNRVHPQKDITAHAEIDAIRNAGEAMFDAKIKK